MSSTNELPKLDTCGCCEPPIAQYAPHDNPPGQPAIAYRIGRYSSFMRRMLERVPFQAIPDGPNVGKRPLAGLVTGGNQDPAVALLDAWSSSLDVLTFYQERIANEGYLRTATERRSVLELARSIGYELNPGVAASTHLVFTVESALGNTTKVQVPVGTRIQNVPTTQTLPQTFETVAELEARADLNVLYPRKTQVQTIGPSSTGIYLKGTATLLQAGDTLLLIGSERYRDNSPQPTSQAWYVVTITGVTPNSKEGYTYVTWGKTLSANPATGFTLDQPRAFAMRQRAALFGHNAPDWKSMAQSVKDAYGNGTDWPNMTMSDSGALALDSAYSKFYAGGWMVVTGAIQPAPVTATGPGGPLTAVAPSTATKLYRIVKAAASTRAEFTISGRSTVITHDVTGSNTQFLRREALVYGQSEELELVEEPQIGLVDGKEIDLDRYVPNIEKGRTVIISGRRGRVRALLDNTVKISYLNSASIWTTRTVAKGEILTVMSRTRDLAAPSFVAFTLRTQDGIVGVYATKLPSPALESYPADPDELPISEVLEIFEADPKKNPTKLILSKETAATYDRSSVEIFGNVVYATHGETVAEVLGSGDGSRSNQKFALKKPPLTYVPAANASGNETTLEVRVNGVSWAEVPFLFGHGSREQIYMVRTSNEGNTSVVFGDGINGVRVPTGLENVTARYRSGIGPDGEVASGSLILLQTRPLGIRGVTNPLPATGSAPPEEIDQARTNAPGTVLTFDRIVSLNDFESFTRGFAGVGKTIGTLLWKGNDRIIHLTVAGYNGAAPGTTLKSNLISAIAALQDPIVQVEVDGYDLKTFNVNVIIEIDSRYLEEDVIAAVKAAILAEFSFENRAFGQRVTSSEVMALLQKVPGVIGVDIEDLSSGSTSAMDRSAAPAATGANAQSAVITANLPHYDRFGAFHKAELLLVNPGTDGIVINTR